MGLFGKLPPFTAPEGPRRALAFPALSRACRLQPCPHCSPQLTGCRLADTRLADKPQRRPHAAPSPPRRVGAGRAGGGPRRAMPKAQTD